MISVLVSFRNSRQLAFQCLTSMLRTFSKLDLKLEILLIDDNSDPQHQIPELMTGFRSELPAGIKATEFLFKEHQHYTRALAYGLSASKGDHVLFVSHDMILTPDYVRTVLAVAALDSSIGLVRGTSPFVDCFPQHRVALPFPLRTSEDLDSFAEYVSRYWGLRWVEDRSLTGDSMLIKRDVLERIGVFDTRYFGYFGDIDFGLRLQRAGFKMACAKGAWLWHEGAGAYKAEAATTKQDYSVIHGARMKIVNEAYRRFREKWDTSLPPHYPGVDLIPFDELRRRPSSSGNEFHPLVFPDRTICEMR